MPRATKQLDKTDPEYLEKRKRNNEAIKKSREKAKARAEVTQRSIEHFSTENKRIEHKISVQKEETEFLKDIFKANASKFPGEAEKALKLIAGEASKQINPLDIKYNYPKNPTLGNEVIPECI